MPSTLRPHVLARERLLLWRPSISRQALDTTGRPIPLTQDDLRRVIQVLALAWTEGTSAVYGSGLLVYHVFCDSKGVQEDQRAPSSTPLILSFITTLAGSYSRSAIENYVAAVHAWHKLHGVSWPNPAGAFELAFKAAANVAPPASKRLPREPVLLAFIERMHGALDLTLHLDVAVYACLCITFWATARLGEFVVPTLTSFDGEIHVKRSDLLQQHDRANLEVLHHQLMHSHYAIIS